MTRNGIEYDLSVTPYTYRDDKHNLILHFSSILNKKKFIERYKFNVSNRMKMFASKNDIEIFNDLFYELERYYTILEYKKIEKRGFYIVSTKYKDNPIVVHNTKEVEQI